MDGPRSAVLVFGVFVILSGPALDTAEFAYGMDSTKKENAPLVLTIPTSATSGDLSQAGQVRFQDLVLGDARGGVMLPGCQIGWTPKHPAATDCSSGSIVVYTKLIT